MALFFFLVLSNFSHKFTRKGVFKFTLRNNFVGIEYAGNVGISVGNVMLVAIGNVLDM